jgi:hypothetical protein
VTPASTTLFGFGLWWCTRWQPAIPMAERVQEPVGDSGLPPLYPK